MHIRHNIAAPYKKSRKKLNGNRIKVSANWHRGETFEVFNYRRIDMRICFFPLHRAQAKPATSCAWKRTPKHFGLQPSIKGGAAQAIFTVGTMLHKSKGTRTTKMLCRSIFAQHKTVAAEIITRRSAFAVWKLWSDGKLFQKLYDVFSLSSHTSSYCICRFVNGQHRIAIHVHRPQNPSKLLSLALPLPTML